MILMEFKDIIPAKNFIGIFKNNFGIILIVAIL
jgi:hypothetical protein